MQPLAICLMGPTACGKSALAMQLAARFDLEIVSVDSAQVFRDMDVGTAKPDAAERAAVRHHLIDLITPDQAYSAARFRSDALAAIAAIAARGRLPLLVGGTMLYYKALRDGLSDLPPAQADMRAEIDAQAARDGWPALHAELARLDAAAAARLKPTDAQRIQRALEIVRLTGAPLADAYARRDSAELPVRLAAIGLVPDQRAPLHAAIGRRFEAMLAAGLVEELRALREKYALDAGMPSMRCVGYRQAWEFLDGDIDRRALLDKGTAATRQLAKRQLTWLRAMPLDARFDSDSAALGARVGDWIAARLDQAGGT
ncbi:MAG: tRNA (adenosine(37)-N6)-dimethylallyltransferase MiaA [Rhodocyclaceae bacterium]|nr:tRNA (adenosine(37)-N6)-dimethylallyltransferase MiaA [Rhodocyclaceae bacterium]MBX3668112.1 tRNA (adenosine(37)-N6)-dimethylallyltransferase MiaA [Rhodocyclaceae bacterium]